MSKVVPLNRTNGDIGGYLFFCPGCKCDHLFDSRWEFNGDVNHPTFTPSLLVNGRGQHGPNNPRCHSFVRNGLIEFLSDCDHELAGKTVGLCDYDKAAKEGGMNTPISVHVATLRGLLTGLDKPDHYMHALAEIEAEITRLRTELEAKCRENWEDATVEKFQAEILNILKEGK